MPEPMMDMKLPGIIVTGASGFVGRHFLEAAEGRFRLFCIARRSQFEAGVARSDNRRWTQVDIAHRKPLMEIARCVKDHGGAEYILHLAGYYDFTYRDHPEYQRTNVRGTENVLALAAEVGCRHFLYSSSLAACRFPKGNAVITEDTPADADFPYARSKRDAEERILHFDGEFKRSIIRFAALFSDWCEYPPVYAFLKTWLSQAWNARVLGGRGNSAVPYLHIRDLTAMLMRIIDLTERLPTVGTYNASPSHTTTHEQMYRAATKYLFGQPQTPLHVPRALALPGVAVRQRVMDAIGRPPFERTWMVRYIDRELRVDATRTQELLHWTPTPRYDILRRMLIMIENMKSHAEAWRLRNEAAFVHVARRPNLVLYNCLLRLREEIVEEIHRELREAQQARTLDNYERMTENTLTTYVSLFYEVLITSIRTRDRSSVRTYARMLAYHRHRQGFLADQVCEALETFGRVIHAHLRRLPSLNISAHHINEYVDLSLQLTIDEVEESYAQLGTAEVLERVEFANVNLLSDDLEMRRIVDELHDICHDGWEIRSILRG